MGRSPLQATRGAPTGDLCMLGDLTEWVSEIVDGFGYAGVAFLVLIENVFPPIPSEVVLGLAGFTASRGEATLLGMLAASTAGSVAGAWLLYGLAAAIGPARVHRLVLRYGKWVRITGRDVTRAEEWFDRWSTVAVLVCRCIPLVRSLISVPAGFRRMPFAPFTLYTALGSLVWNAIFISAGYLLGEQWERVLAAAETYKYVTLAGLGLVTLVAAVLFWRSRSQVVIDEA